MNKRIQKKHMSIDYLCRKAKDIYIESGKHSNGLLDVFPIDRLFHLKPNSIYNGRAQMKHAIEFLDNRERNNK